MNVNESRRTFFSCACFRFLFVYGLLMFFFFVCFWLLLLICFPLFCCATVKTPRNLLIIHCPSPTAQYKHSTPLPPPPPPLPPKKEKHNRTEKKAGHGVTARQVPQSCAKAVCGQPRGKKDKCDTHVSALGTGHASRAGWSGGSLRAGESCPSCSPDRSLQHHRHSYSTPHHRHTVTAGHITATQS